MNLGSHAAIHDFEMRGDIVRILDQIGVTTFDDDTLDLLSDLVVREAKSILEQVHEAAVVTGKNVITGSAARDVLFSERAYHTDHVQPARLSLLSPAERKLVDDANQLPIGPFPLSEGLPLPPHALTNHKWTLKLGDPAAECVEIRNSRGETVALGPKLRAADFTPQWPERRDDAG